MQAAFCILEDAGLIAFSGEDATSFLHAQLTSDVAGLAVPRTQFSGYCSPKGRLLATFLVWRRPADMLLQLPSALREALQARLARYVLRARVSVADATARHAAFGVAGSGAGSALAAAGLPLPSSPHDVVSAGGVYITQVPVGRYLVLAEAARAADVLAMLGRCAAQQDESLWSRLNIEAGIPVITPATQDRYVPQMINLDLIGGVSYTKGCYPGQEIVARTYHLGRVKQRAYRVHVPTPDPVLAGDPLFSPQFGAAQAAGTILDAIRTDRGGHDALAVIQTSSVESGPIRVQSLDGPAVEFLALPYALPS